MLVPSARAKESLPSHLFSSLHFRVILLCKWGVISCELKLLLNPWLPLGDHADTAKSAENAENAENSDSATADSK